MSVFYFISFFHYSSDSTAFVEINSRCKNISRMRVRGSRARQVYTNFGERKNFDGNLKAIDR